MSPEQPAKKPRVLNMPSGDRPARPDTTVVMPDGTQRIPLGSGVITAFLGQGGMANVYEIWNGQLEVYRAVKLINPNCNRDARERFQTEIKITAKLHHPNITEIYGVGHWNALPFIEMEKLEGATLDELVRERGALPPYVCTAVGIMIGRALKYAHSQEYALYGNNYTGVIHRDLKPSNIMLCNNGVVKLMDFGIASPAEASFHTVAGTVLGTLQYLAPEQLESKKLDVTSDLYALGATLYELLTGTMAFPEPGVHKLMLDKLKGKFRPLDDYRLHIPRRLRKVIHRCMQQEQSKRIQSADDLLRQLGRIHSRLTTDTPEQVMRRLVDTPVTEKVVVGTRVRWPVRAAAALLLAVGAGVAAWYAAPAILEALAPPEPEPVAVAPDTPGPEKPSVTRAADAPVATVALTRPQPAKPAPRPIAPAPVEPSAPSPAPEPPAPAPEPEPKTFMETMQEKYAGLDGVAILKREFSAGAHANALKVYEHLPDPQKSSTEAQLYKLRALKALGNTSALRTFVSSTTIPDAEYYLVRGQLAYESKNLAEAERLLEKSLATPRLLADYEMLKRDVNYYRALCATAQYDDSPTDANYKKAMDCWWQVKSQLRGQPNHRYNKRMLTETQRIGQAHRSKG